MSVSRHVRWSFLAVFTLCVATFMSSCSKKEVKQDEPLINPSGDNATAAPVDAAVGTGNAGAESAPIADSGEFGTAYFDFDSFKIRGDARDVLKTNANFLKSNPSVSVQIEGHCDERGTTEYNLALGERRANAARDYLVRLGIDKARLSVISYGKERAQDSGHDESAWAKNRRASFVKLSQ